MSTPGNGNNTAVGGNPSPVDRLLAILATGDLRDLVKVVNFLDEIMKRAQYLNKKDLASLYLKLMDRVFGEEVTGAQEGLATSNLTIQSVALSSANGNWIKGELGGWYRKMINMSALSRLGPLRGKHEVAMVTKTLWQSLTSPDHERLVKYLSAQSPFITFLQSNLRKIFEWKTNQLPSRIQMIIMEHPLYPCLRSESSERLWLLLHGGHLDSKERELIRTNKSVRLDCIEYFMVTLVKYPVKNPAYISKKPTNTLGSSSVYSSPYALSRNSVSSGGRSPVEVLRQNGCMGWVEGVPYLVNLMDYMHEYLLITQDTAPVVGDITSPNGTAVPTASQGTITASMATKTRLREIFIRLCIDSWIALGNVLHQDHYMVATYRSMLNSSYVTTSSLYPDRNKQKPHPDPTETVVLDYESFQWTTAICQCTYLLLWTSLRDMSAIHTYIANRGDDLKDGMESSNVVFGHGDPAWSQLQQPLYDMIRCVFSKGDQAKIGRDILYLTVELWLLYIQPWSVHGNATTAGSNNFNISHESWKRYIAYNLHFYTTLLPCFLKVISKMNISPMDTEGSGNLDMLNRVLKVFNADLIRTMTQLSTSFADWYSEHIATYQRLTLGSGKTPRRDHSSYLASPSPAQHTPTKSSTRRFLSATSPSTESELTSVYHFLMKDQHLRLYPDPRVNELKDHGITDYQSYSLDASASIVFCIEIIQDTQKKSEENKPQQNESSFFSMVKKWLDDMFSEPIAPTAVVDPSKFALLESCRKQFVAILPTPELREQIDRMKSTAVGLGPSGEESSSGVDIRDRATGKLNAKGKDLMKTSILQFRPQDYHAETSYHKDPLYLPCCSFEFPMALKLSQYLTHIINSRLNLPAQDKNIRLKWSQIFEEERKSNPNVSFIEVFTNNFRVNLRFLAAYRTLSFMGFLLLYVAMKCDCLSKTMQVVLAIFLSWVAYKGAVHTKWYKF